MASQVLTVRHDDGTIVVSWSDIGALLVRPDSPGLAERLLFALADEAINEAAGKKVRVFVRAGSATFFRDSVQQVPDRIHPHVRFEFLHTPDQLRGTRNPLVWRARCWQEHPNASVLTHSEVERESCRWTPPCPTQSTTP